MVAPVIVQAQAPVAPKPAPIKVAPVQKKKPIVFKTKAAPRNKVVIKKSTPAPVTPIAQPKLIAVQAPLKFYTDTNRKDEKVATFIDDNVEKAIKASGNKTPAPEALAEATAAPV